MSSGGVAGLPWHDTDPPGRSPTTPTTAASCARGPSDRVADAVTAARGLAEAAEAAPGHLAPVVLGAGTPLFTGGTPRSLAQRSVVVTSTASHLTYDVARS